MQDCTELKSWHLYFHCMNQQGSSPTYVIWKGTPPLLLLVTVKIARFGFLQPHHALHDLRLSVLVVTLSFKVMDIDFQLHLKGTHVGNAL